MFANPRVEFIHSLDGKDHADRAAQAQASFRVANIDGTAIECLDQADRAQAAQQGLVLHHAEIAFLAGDGAILFTDFAGGDNRVLSEAEALCVLFVQLAQDKDHERFIQFVAGAAITVFRDGLEDSMIVIMEELEAGQFERCLARGAMPVDEIVIVLVIVFILIKERLSQ